MRRRRLWPCGRAQFRGLGLMQPRLLPPAHGPPGPPRCTRAPGPAREQPVAAARALQRRSRRRRRAAARSRVGHRSRARHRAPLRAPHPLRLLLCTFAEQSSHDFPSRSSLEAPGERSHAPPVVSNDAHTRTGTSGSSPENACTFSGHSDRHGRAPAAAAAAAAWFCTQRMCSHTCARARPLSLTGVRAATDCMPRCLSWRMPGVPRRSAQQAAFSGQAHRRHCLLGPRLHGERRARHASGRGGVAGRHRSKAADGDGRHAAKDQREAGPADATRQHVLAA